MTVQAGTARARAARSREPGRRVGSAPHLVPARPVAAGSANSSSVAPHHELAMEAILRHVHDALFATDLDNRITFWGESAERMLGYAAVDAVGHEFADLLPFRIAPGTGFEDLTRAVAAGRTWRGEGSVIHPSGREIWLESTVSPIVADGAIVGSVSVSRDMTEQHVAEEALAQRARLLHALAEYSAVASGVHSEAHLGPALIDAVRAVIPSDYVVLIVLDPTTGRYVVRATFGAEGAVGAEIRPSEGSAGRAIATRSLVVVDHLERSTYGPAVRDHIRHEALTTAAVPLLHDGVVLGAITVARGWAEGSGFSEAEREALTLFAGHAVLAIANVRLLAEVSELAVHDGLTGLFNRRHFDASLELLIARWRRQRDAGEPISAIMFDLDRFGRLNRDHGHQAGDAVLRAFGGILHERLRSSDLVARYGGEEFIAVLEATPQADAVALANEVRRTLEGRRITGPNGTLLSATVSAGVATLDPSEPSAEALLRAADVGLFMAKRAGRNQVVAT